LCIHAGLDIFKGDYEKLQSGAYLWFAIANLGFLFLWFVGRGRPRSLRFIRAAEMAALPLGTLAVSFGFRVSMPGNVAATTSFGLAHPSIVLGGDLGLPRVLLELSCLLLSLLFATQTLALRAALVPSPLKHSAIVTALAGFPVCIFSALGWPAMYPDSIPFTRNDRGFVMSFGVSWWLFTVAVCAVIAHVVHRLQSEVQVAKRLGHYELGEKIGEGGMGVVYRARHAMMKRPVAIKLLRAGPADQEALTRFEREVQLTSQLSHPNTVIIHDYGRTHEGVFYYVMEYIDGATLEHVIRQTGVMPPGRVVRVLEMTAGALGEAHERGLVHRDVKPANILLTARGGEPDVAKVLDFGLVRPVRTNSEITNAGIMMGTPLFMSPEAIRSPDRVDARSDLYSLGAIAYYLLTGHPVFQAESAIEVCAKHMHATPTPLSELVPGVDVELEAVVMACLAKNPAQRPASARVLREALARCPSRAEWTRERAIKWWKENEARLRMPQQSEAAPMAQPQVA
jgi:serine/threonine-protein kinase